MLIGKRENAISLINEVNIELGIKVISSARKIILLSLMNTMRNTRKNIRLGVNLIRNIRRERKVPHGRGGFNLI